MKHKILIKTISWAIISIIVALSTSFFIFGEVTGSFKLVALDMVVFTTLYVTHEWFWRKK